MVFDNKVYWEIKSYYSQEFQIGQFALQRIEDEFSLHLPEAEAANIAFHFINAQQDYSSQNAARIAKLIGDLETLIRYNPEFDLQKDELSYQRFITHLRFFVERLFADKMLADHNQALFNQVRQTMPHAMAEAVKVQKFVETYYNKSVTMDELTYLAIHFQRFL